MSNPTSGHAINHPGLRGHSIGPLYPWGVVGRGYEGWSVTNHLTGYTSPVVWKNYQDARDIAWQRANGV